MIPVAEWWNSMAVMFDGSTVRRPRQGRACHSERDTKSKVSTTYIGHALL